MTEQQLRDVLARVLPEPPDSVADASPVVRAARRHRQLRVAGVTALAAVLVAGTVVGVRALDTDDSNLVAEQPKPEVADPYATAPCPELSEPWVSTPVEDLDQVVAVRYCTRDVDNGFPAADGPNDALVDSVSVFADAARGLASADPARCAAVDPIPTDSRLLLQLADGTYVGVPAGICQDAVLEGRAIDGADVTNAFLAVLGEQRDQHDYYLAVSDIPSECSVFESISPARPGHESIVAASVCSGDALKGVPVDDSAVAQLDEAWRAGRRAEECAGPEVEPATVFALTDHGDLLRMTAHPCGYLTFDKGAVTYEIPVTADDLIG